MTNLLRDMTPLPWMEQLNVRDLNVWLGDGHFRNTLHNDPFDNFLCQLRGLKHLLLWPPESGPDLYYASRRDIQASYEVGRGEYGRHDTGIVSTNTAAVNGAAPDLQAFPRYAHARTRQTVCHVQPGDCLFLPRGHHHHVFSEADSEQGFNLAINIWVHPPGPTASDTPKPSKLSLGRLQRVLVDAGAGPVADSPSTEMLGSQPSSDLTAPPMALKK